MTRISRRAAVAVLAASIACALAPIAASAHHGWTDYDADHPLTLKGRVATSSYENPHATITMSVDGRTWQCVLAPVSRMESRGASREAVAVGREVTVVGYPSRSHPGEMRAERIVVDEGGTAKTVELR